MMDTILRKPSEEKPWLKYFLEEGRTEDFPRDTVYNVLKNNNKDFPNDCAINYYGNKISYGKLLATIDQAAAALASLGVGKGDIVACSSVTIPEMIVSVYAANKIGATLLAIDLRRNASFVKETLDKSGAKVFLFIEQAYQLVQPVLNDLSVKKIVVISATEQLPLPLKIMQSFKNKKIKIDYNDKMVNWKTFLSYGKGKTSATAAYGENDVVAITYTGGTTGDPKGVLLTDDGFNSIYHSVKYCGVDYERGQKFLDIIPAFSSYGIVASMHMPLCLGLELDVIPLFDDNKVGSYIKRYKPAHTLLVPSHYEKLMNSKEMRNGFDLSFLVTAGSGGDTMNLGLENKLNSFLKERGCKFPLSQGYGMSEVSSAASCCCGGNFKSLSVGYPLLHCVISVFKPDTTEELGYNEEGEICITGPGVMKGYYQNEEESENIMKRHPDGRVWIHSGDVGYIDEDGFIFIKGRIKRMITRYDGHKIFPTAVESAICKVKSVDSCAVIDVNDPDHAQGRLALAVVQLKSDCDTDAVRREIDAALESELEVKGRPAYVEIIDEMPHTSIGKIDFAKLSEIYNKKYK